MFFAPLILAAGSLPTLISGAPIPSFLSGSESSHSLTERSAFAYTVFGGNGAVSAGWPTIGNWVTTFDQMFEANKATMKGSCAQFSVPNNSDQEINDIFNSIQSVASSTGVDPRFILAVVMQESNGCVRAPTTNYGVVNPGLMQSHDGSGSCNINGQVLNPCPASQIQQMITDGTAGTSSGAGLQQCLAEVGGSGVSQYYRAARVYNSGSIAPSGNLGQGIATHCYVSDITNRLLGWSSGPSSCQSGVIGTLSSALSSLGSLGSGLIPTSTSTSAPAPTESSTSTQTSTPTESSTSTQTSTPTETSAPTSPAPTSTTTTPETPATTSTATVSSTPSSSSSVPIYPYAISSCQEYETVQSGDYCLNFDSRADITLPQLLSWNPGLDSSCSNLWLGYQYCVKA